jgi:hypothetical protein
VTKKLVAAAKSLACSSKPVFTKESLRAFMSTSIALPAILVSDMVHDRTVTGGGLEPASKWRSNGLLTRSWASEGGDNGQAGTHHAVKFTKYAHCYAADAQDRFNRGYGASPGTTRVAAGAE